MRRKIAAMVGVAVLSATPFLLLVRLSIKKRSCALLLRSMGRSRPAQICPLSTWRSLSPSTRRYWSRSRFASSTSLASLFVRRPLGFPLRDRRPHRCDRWSRAQQGIVPAPCQGSVGLSCRSLRHRSGTAGCDGLGRRAAERSRQPGIGDQPPRRDSDTWAHGRAAPSGASPMVTRQQRI